MLLVVGRAGSTGLVSYSRCLVLSTGYVLTCILFMINYSLTLSCWGEVLTITGSSGVRSLCPRLFSNHSLTTCLPVIAIWTPPILTTSLLWTLPHKGVRLDVHSSLFTCRFFKIWLRILIKQIVVDISLLLSRATFDYLGYCQTKLYKIQTVFKVCGTLLRSLLNCITRKKVFIRRRPSLSYLGEGWVGQ